MGIDQARQRNAHGFGLGGIDADAGAAARRVNIENVECPPRAGDDRGQPAGIAAAGSALPRDALSRSAVEQLKTPLDGVCGVLGFHRARVGGIDERHRALRVAGPQRRR